LYDSGVIRTTALRLAVAGAVMNLATALAVIAIRWTHSSVGARRAEGVLPTLALGAVVAAPGVVALVGVATQRAVLFAAAAVASGPITIISIATFPLVVPALLLILAFAISGRPLSTPVPAVGVVVGFALILAFALALLLTGMREYSYNFPGGGSESGGYVPAARAALCLLLVAVDVAATTALSTPSQ
jgi:hypothetical protein